MITSGIFRYLKGRTRKMYHGPQKKVSKKVSLQKIFQSAEPDPKGQCARTAKKIQKKKKEKSNK